MTATFGGFQYYYPGTFPEPQTLSGMCMCAKLLQSCLTLCNPMGCNLPGSSVHGIFQARILGWVAHFLLQGTKPPLKLGFPRKQNLKQNAQCVTSLLEREVERSKVGEEQG